MGGGTTQQSAKYFEPKEINMVTVPEQEGAAPVHIYQDPPEFSKISNSKKASKKKYMFAEVGRGVTKTNRKVLIRENGVLRSARKDEERHLDKYPYPSKKYL